MFPSPIDLSICELRSGALFRASRCLLQAKAGGRAMLKAAPESLKNVAGRRQNTTFS
jgi:hypothetical protein